MKKCRRSHDQEIATLVFRVDPKLLANAVERVWAEPLGKNQYRVRNVPFLVSGVSLYDVVKAIRINGELRAFTVLRRGGHSTFRLLLERPMAESHPTFARFWRPLKRLGCGYERGRDRFIVIDVPHCLDIPEVVRHSKEANRRGAGDIV